MNHIIEFAVIEVQNDIVVVRAVEFTGADARSCPVDAVRTFQTANEMLVSDDADVNGTLDEEIEKLKILDPAAFAPMPLPKSELPAFSSAAPRTKLPETSPLFENGTPIFSFLRRPQSNG